jgi:hypothetical protein
MHKNIITTILISCLFISCSSNNSFSYNQDFAALEKSLLPSIELTENSVKNHIESFQFDSVVIVSEKMEHQVDSCIAILKNKPAANAKLGEKFKVDAIKYFEFFKSIYNSYKNYGSAVSEKGRMEEALKMQAVIATKDQAIQKIQQSQKEFAEANGFKIGN